MGKGFFITFEGGDGAGKSTQIQILKSFLESEGYRVLLKREPGGTAISEAIRKILLDPDHREMDPVTECLLYAAARAQLVAQEISPALDAGQIVICDRFLDSSIAYQAYGRGLGSMVQEINRYGIRDCMPDLTVYLRVDPQTGMNRITNRRKDRIESEPETFREKVFHGYEQLCAEQSRRILCIDASRGIEDIASEIRREAIGRIQQKQI